MQLNWIAQATPETEEQAASVIDGLTAPITRTNIDWSQMAHRWMEGGINLGIRVVLALVLFFVGRLIIRYILRLMRHAMERRHLEGLAVSLFNSLFTALLYIVLAIAIASTLGVQSVSFAAILASMGLAIGMALSGQLQNFAGGVIILVTKPFRIGDFIEAQGQMGTVEQVNLFHTRISTVDNQIIYIPNGILSSGVIGNLSSSTTRRAEWIIGIDYDSDTHAAKAILRSLLDSDERIHLDPAPVVELHSFGESSVNLIVRAWTLRSEYWEVYWSYNQRVFDAFAREGISFPYPQITISKR